MECWTVEKCDLAKMLFNSGCIKFGTFTLKSGVVSPVYIDLRAVTAFPMLLKSIAHEYVHLLKQLEFNQLAALPYAGLPIGTAISLNMDVPMLYPRKETKTYGTRACIEGVHSFGETVVIIDDLVTSGASVYEALEKLQSKQLHTKDIVVLIDREGGGAERLTKDGYALHSVFKFTELLAYLKFNRMITSETYMVVHDFLARCKSVTDDSSAFL